MVEPGQVYMAVESCDVMVESVRSWMWGEYNKKRTSSSWIARRNAVGMEWRGCN